jgi:glycosyltransferase involved in cell wall biosynthesis
MHTSLEGATVDTASVSEANAKDFHKLVALRDEIKLAHGLAQAAKVFTNLHNRFPTNEVALNLAIALFEADDAAKAASILRSLMEADEGAFGHPGYGALISLYFSWSVGRSDPKAAAQFLLERVAKNDPSSDRLLDVLLTDFFDSEIHAHLQQLATNGASAQISSQAFRSLYEKLSAADSLPALISIIPILDRDRVLTDELNKLAAIFGHLSKDEWPVVAETLATDHGITSQDAYLIALQAIERLPSEDAKALIDALARRGNEFHACDRVAATLLEISGRTEVAIDRHHTASTKEYAHRGETPSFKRMPLGEVRVSCIAISFNDGPLVEHFCRSIIPHCDEIIVNDGGSTDNTVEEFRRVAAETGFPIRVIEDVQHGNRDRTIFNKEGYRAKGQGGVLGFDADRRRSTTLMMAQHEYVLMADMDDYFPPHPNMKCLIAGAYGIEHFAGARLETISRGQFTVLQLGPVQGCPTLFKRHPHHVYAGVSFDDEYLSRLDRPLSELAATYMADYLTNCFNYWHLKFFLDPRNLKSVQNVLGPKHSSVYRYDKPVFAAIPVPEADFNHLAENVATLAESAQEAAKRENDSSQIQDPDVVMPSILKDHEPFSTARIGLIGNCQASALASILFRMKGVKLKFVLDINGEGSDTYNQAHHAAVHDDIVDFCFSQPLSENFSEIQSERLREKYDSRFRLYTNLYFTGYHPDLTYFGTRDLRVQSAMGDYNSRITLIGYAKGLTIDETVSLFNRESYEKLNYFSQFEASRAELLRRDDGNDVKYAAEFFQIAVEHVPLYTVNHPTAHALAPLASLIVHSTGQARPVIDVVNIRNPLVESSIWPVYPEVATALALNYVGGTTFYAGYHEDLPPMSLREFVKISFERYDTLGRENLMAIPGAENFASVQL